MTGASCPRDRATADEVTERTPAGELVLDLCPDCAGIWLDGGELAKIAGERNLEMQLAGAKGTASSLSCPRCAVPLTTKSFLDVEVDVCFLCNGVWFDHAELEHLQIAYLDYLDRTREAAIAEEAELTAGGTGSMLAWAARQESVAR